MGGKEEIRFAVIWQENRQSVCAVWGVFVSGGCLFITCCVMTSVTHHLPFLGRVIDQPVFQHVNKMIPTCSTSCKILSRLSSMAMTSSAPNTGRGATGVFFFFLLLLLPLCMRVFWCWCHLIWSFYEVAPHTFQRYVKFVPLWSDKMYSSNETRSVQ